VRNESKPRFPEPPGDLECPRCGSRSIAAVAFGYPSRFCNELWEAVGQGRLVLGGCCIMGDGSDPRWHCHDCGLRWERQDGKPGRVVDIGSLERETRRLLDQNPSLREATRGMSWWETIRHVNGLDGRE
jgi:rubredoxin